MQESLFISLDYSLRNEVIWLKNFIEPQARKVKMKKQRPKKPAPVPSPQEVKKQSSKKKVRSEDVAVIENDSTEAEVDKIFNQIYEHALLSPKKQIIQIRDRNGDILYKLNSPEKDDLYFEDIPYNSTALVTVYDSKGQPLRLAATQSAVAKIYVAYPESEITEVLGNLFLLFLYLMPVALLVSVLGGYFLANKSLRPVGQITTTAREITAQNLDQRIRHSGVDDELGRLVSTFNDMIERLQLSFQQIQQFSIDASHELRTPLTIMRGEIELALRSKQTSEHYRQVLSSTLDETLRMSSIIENLLLMAKADIGRTVIQTEPLDVTALIRELHEDSQLLSETKHISVTLGTVDEITLNADPIRLRQALLNIIDNAIKYTPEGGNVILALIREGENAQIIIRDSGIGIPEEEKNRIFDRFYRVDKGRSREMGGTGLGLSICKWIIESHGGSIQVDSVVGNGSTFIVSLPMNKI